jgi:hypothetical protein
MRTARILVTGAIRTFTSRHKLHRLAACLFRNNATVVGLANEHSPFFSRLLPKAGQRRW